MYIHCLPVTKLYTTGYLGWWTLASSVYESIKTHKFLRGKAAGADQGVRTPTPGQQRTSSQPPLKRSKLDADAQDDDSSSTSWQSVSSSSDVAEATESLARISLETSPVKIKLESLLPRPQFEAVYVPPLPGMQKELVGGEITPTEPCEWTCDDPLCGKDNKQCSNCAKWRRGDFEQDWSVRGGSMQQHQQQQQQRTKK